MLDKRPIFPSARPVPRSLPLAILGAGFLAAAPSLAATYYVGPTGNDTNAGTSASAPFATVGKANAVVRPGDVVRVLNGSYADYPRPALSGTAAARITYIGNLTRPDLVRITDGAIGISRDHLTIKGFTLTKGFDLMGNRDSIAHCVVTGLRPQIKAANDCVVAHCTFDAERFWFFGSETDSLPVASRDTIVDCTFRLRPATPAGHTIRFKSIGDGVIERCRFDIEIGAGATNASPTKLFWVRRMKFVDCSWDVTNRVTAGADEAGWFVLRDFTQSNLFQRDTITMRGPGEVQFFGSASGTHPQTVMNNNFEGCLWKMDGPLSYRFGIYYQDEARWDTLSRCVVVSRQTALGINGRFRGPTLIDHCTFASFSPYLGSFAVLAGSASGTLAMKSNVFFTAPGAPSASTSAPLYADRATVTGHLDSDHNVFYSSLGAATAINAPGLGTSAPGPGQPWSNATGADVHSIFGAPRFENASSVAAFDAHVGAGSAVIGAGLGGSDAGAFPFAGPDVTPPSAVLDLGSSEVGDHSLVLTWTAPGDDGTIGIVTNYDLRWSTTPITAGTFESAQSMIDQPVPLAAGSHHEHPVEDLEPGQTYFYALRVQDEAGNWSPMSNVVSVTTEALDVLKPAPVTDLGGVR